MFEIPTQFQGVENGFPTVWSTYDILPLVEGHNFEFPTEATDEVELTDWQKQEEADKEAGWWFQVY